MPLNSLTSCVSLKRKLDKDSSGVGNVLKAASPGILSHDCATLALLDTFPKGGDIKQTLLRLFVELKFILPPI